MITLNNDYFKIDNCTNEGEDTLFSITLLPDYCAYEGHFPGNPVSPGVCNIQMIKECAEQLAGKRFFLGYISRCKLSAVITPQTTPQLSIRMRLSEAEGLYNVNAVVSDNETTYIDFKGELTPVS
jgi:3-hydroxymyristoyl/3-hydroxydecanoyl-(acyl carrier protein) dehydratases